MTGIIPPFNPYVGPRTFQEEEADRFFGREREARELLALVVSERLTLFYAQSGAGKSSLINTRLAPDLRREGFTVLPVGRVSGVLPEEVAPQTVDNIFVYHLILGLSQKLAENDLRSLADTEQELPDLVDTSLARFLSGETGPDPDKEINTELPPTEGLVPHVLIIDQFEELLTTYPDRWQERAGFFERLSAAMARHPNLWVVLTLREDYIAGLEPYAQLMPNRLRARFYMQRMGIEAAREAVERPAAQAKRPFAKGVPNMLVDNLRRVRTAGQTEYHAGEYVEPVQLQVVCFQLWEDLRDKQAATIELADLERLAGGGNLAEYVDRALSDFYERAIVKVLEAPDTGVTEHALRSWFSDKLITEAGTRSIVFRNETTGDTVGLPNRAVDLLTAQFLLRTELRAGGAWVELVHDRFIEPIQRSNQQWSLQQSLPEIVRFEVHPKVISPGVEITVAWEINNADIVQVEPIRLALEGLRGTARVNLERSTPLQLSAKRQGQPPVLSRAQNIVVAERAGASQIQQLAQMSRQGRLTVLLGREIDRRLLFGGADTTSEAWTTGALTDDPLALRERYLRFVKDLLIWRVEAADSPQLKKLVADIPDADGATVSEIAGRLGYLDPIPPTLLNTLAALQASVYVTSSPYTLLEESLQMMGKAPRSEVCRWHPGLDRLSSVFEDHPEYVPTFESPLVFHLYGLELYPESLVLTEDDYVAFLTQLREDRERIPIAVRYAIHRHFDLFLGYDAQSWDFKALYYGVVATSLDRRVGGVLQLESAVERSQAEIDLQEASVRRAGLDVFWGDPESLVHQMEVSARTDL